MTIIYTGREMRIFVDTSAWFALNNRKDQHHQQAVNFIADHRSSPILFLTNDYVIDETVTLLRFKVSHREAAAFLRLFSRSRQLVCEQVTPEDIKRAEEIFLHYRDKSWSFTDCVSFAFMEERDLQDAFAFDANFSQFGVLVHPSR
jgi:predicted nucleic acid-binding protein